MKKAFLTLSFIALLSTSFVSCSTDDSALETSAEEFNLTGPISNGDNGNKDLPKPPQRP